MKSPHFSFIKSTITFFHKKSAKFKIRGLGLKICSNWITTGYFQQHLINEKVLMIFFRYWTMDRSLQRRLQKTNYQHIKRLCRDRGTLFEDPDFPPVNKSIYSSKKPPLHPIVWLRPHVSYDFLFDFFNS